MVRLTTVALLAGEHVLLEDVPGVGKTLVGKALARSVAGTFHRIQFTPDLLPADITGSSLYNGKTQEFSFSRGPIFANVVLADEINRATPRTQSALLEAMSERQVSVDGQTHPLPRPFMVIATQNPVEFEGTYPLPESQLDRFLLRIPLGYPAREVELEVLNSHRLGEPVETLQPVVSCQQIAALQEEVRRVEVEDSVNGYLLDIVQATRDCGELHVGVSTRGALALVSRGAGGGPGGGPRLRRSRRRQVAGRAGAGPSRHYQGIPARRSAVGGRGPDRTARRGRPRAGLSGGNSMASTAPNHHLPRGLVLPDRAAADLRRRLSIRGVNLLVVLAGLLAGPLLLSRFMAVYSLRGVQARRKSPPGACAGDLLVANITLSNTRRRVGCWAVAVEEQIRPAAGGPRGKRPGQPLRTEVFFAYVPARGTRKGSYRGRLAQRGPYQLGPLRLSTRFPFGLFCHSVTVGQTESLLVFPRLGASPAAGSNGTANRLPAAGGGSSGPAPTAISTAFAPGGAATAAAGSMGGLPPAPENSWCSSSSSRETATWCCCWTCGSPSAPSRRIASTSSWPSVSPPPWWPICAAREAATSIWAPWVRVRSVRAARRRRPCCKT